MIGDTQSKSCAIIDPVRDVSEYLAIANQENLTITDILETHVHADFVSGARELKNQLSGKPTIHCSSLGGDEWLPSYCDRPVKEGDEVILGDIRLKAFHTPGHTPEHIMWILYNNTLSKDKPLFAFSGDCIFTGSIGRPDLLGDKNMQKLSHALYQTLFSKLNTLPDSLKIYPSHGAGSLCGKAIESKDSTTLGFEKEFSVSFQKKSEEIWTRELMKEMPAFPPYFARMKKINIEGPPFLGAHPKPLPSLEAKEVQKWMREKNAILLDTRSKEKFAKEHSANSLSLPKGASFLKWAGWLIEEKTPIILLQNDPEIQRLLSLIGIDTVVGYLNEGLKGWKNSGYTTENTELWNIDKLHQTIYEKQVPLTVLDVRSKEEWEAGHIPKSQLLPLGELPQKISQIDQSKPIVMLCRTGYRSIIATSLAKKLGVKNVIDVSPGMVEWIEKSYPTKKS